MTPDPPTRPPERPADSHPTGIDASRERELNRPEDFRHVVAASRRRLFAIFDDPHDGLAGLAALPAGDLVAGKQTWLFYGETGQRRLVGRGARHGVYGRLVRLLQITNTDDNRYIDALERALHHGALVVAVPVRRIDTADRLAEILHARGGHTFAYTKHMNFVPTLGEI